MGTIWSWNLILSSFLIFHEAYIYVHTNSSLVLGIFKFNELSSVTPETLT